MIHEGEKWEGGLMKSSAGKEGHEFEDADGKDE